MNELLLDLLSKYPELKLLREYKGVRITYPSNKHEYFLSTLDEILQICTERGFSVNVNSYEFDRKGDKVTLTVFILEQPANEARAIFPNPNKDIGG